MKKNKISNKCLCILLGVQIIFLVVMYGFVHIFINLIIVPRNQELAMSLLQIQWYLISTVGVLCAIFIPVCVIVALYRILKSLEYICDRVKNETENDKEEDAT